MSKFKTQYTADKFPRIREKNSGKSLTIPDQAMSVKEIMERHTHGLKDIVTKVPFYDGETEVPDIRRMDISERYELAEAAREKVNEIKKKLQENHTAREKKKQERLVKEAIQRAEKKKAQQQDPEDPKNRSTNEENS